MSSTSDMFILSSDLLIAFKGLLSRSIPYCFVSVDFLTLMSLVFLCLSILLVSVIVPFKVVTFCLLAGKSYLIDQSFSLLALNNMEKRILQK